jgi:hypothetical protein
VAAECCSFYRFFGTLPRTLLETARRRSTNLALYSNVLCFVLQYKKVLPTTVPTTADSQDAVSEGVDSATAADADYEEQEDNVHVQLSRRKRPCANFPWSYTHDWTRGDPVRLRRRQCVICKKWFLQATNAQGWKVHLKNQHSVTDAATAASHLLLQVLADNNGTTSSSQRNLQLQKQSPRGLFLLTWLANMRMQLLTRHFSTCC